MAKQIKKVLFRQISLFVGLALIVSFSSIFGAILLRQVLAAPAGTGSVITAVNNLAIALTDIKGDGFVKNTHSLKQIKDKLDTVGGGGGSYKISASATDACTAQANCGAGYHICKIGEWEGRPMKGQLGGWITEFFWVDTTSNSSTSAKGNCNNFTVCGGTNYSVIARHIVFNPGGLNDIGTISAWHLSTGTALENDCGNPKKALCCSN